MPVVERAKGSNVEVCANQKPVRLCPLVREHAQMSVCLRPVHAFVHVYAENQVGREREGKGCAFVPVTCMPVCLCTEISPFSSSFVVGGWVGGCLRWWCVY